MARRVTCRLQLLFALLMLSGATVGGFDDQAGVARVAEQSISANVAGDQTPHRRDRDEVSAAVDSAVNLAECGKASPDLAPEITFGNVAIAAAGSLAFLSSLELAPRTLQHCRTRLQV